MQGVDVASLRNTAARSREGGNGVPVDQGDALVLIGEHPRRQQAGDARAQDDGVGWLCARGGVHGVPPPG